MKTKNFLLSLQTVYLVGNPDLNRCEAICCLYLPLFLN